MSIDLRSVTDDETPDGLAAAARAGVRGLATVAHAATLALMRAGRPFMLPAQDLHTAIFYLFGRYLEFGKRLCGVRYLFLQRRRGEVGYQVLGILLGTQLISSFLLLAAERLRALSSAASPQPDDLKPETPSSTDEGEDEDDGWMEQDTKSEPKCVFCFGKRRHTTATECGHLFCWGCIISCCDRKAECPLCRQPIRRQTLVRLEHYAPPSETGESGDGDVDEELA